MIIAGIDVGNAGGYAVLMGTTCVASGIMPTAVKVYGKGKAAKKKVSVDIAVLRDAILAIGRPDLVVIEFVGVMPGQGGVSGFTFGKGAGKLVGMCEALNWRYIEVRPQAWKAIILKDTLKDKEAAISYCRHKHSYVELIPPRCRVPSDGIADSLCMADYGLHYLSQDQCLQS